MNAPGAFMHLFDAIFTLAIFLFLTRFLLQLVQADFYNPISQTIVRITHPIITPVQQIIPVVGRANFAALLIVFLLIIGKMMVQFYFAFGRIPFGLGVLVYVLHTTASLLISYFYWAVIIRIILSWIAPDPRQPFTAILIDVTEPLMAPARRLLPAMGGLDFSPIIVLLGLQFLRIMFQL